jgi:hypothetical protein
VVLKTRSVTFGANGILGVGAFVQDDGFYYTCPQGSLRAD